ncbi:MAG: phosphomannomutase/phosphoglucomutase [Methylococcus sp.]|nr:phosphomannomutase/phosphoglucomutase [Methylococcus sp.]
MIAPSLRHLLWAVGVAAVLVVAVTAGGLCWAERYRVDTASGEAMAAAAEAAAFNVRDRLGWTFRALQGMGLDARLAETLASGDAARLAADESRLTDSLPGALLVRLISGHSDLLDTERAPAMGYADLDAIRDARRGQTIPAMHAANSPHVHIALAVPVAEGKGVLLASLSPEVLREAMRSVPMPFGAALELRQGELSLVFTGDADRRKNPPDGAASVLGSRGWQIVYWRPFEDLTPLWWAFAAIGAALALILAAVLAAQRALAGAMAHDRATVLALVADLRAGSPFHAYRARLEETQLLLDALAAAENAEPPLVADPESEPGQLPLPPQPLQKEEKSHVEIPPVPSIDSSLFRAYDIRGIVGDSLSPEAARAIGRAIGSEALDRGELWVNIARDGRLSSPALSAALAEGLRAAGCSVTDLGLAPTPVLYFATHVLSGRSGVMVTGSHNPANYNGFKIVLAGQTLAGEDIQKLRQRIETGDFRSGEGKIERRSLLPDYLKRVVADIQIGRTLKVVVDCGNGVAATVAPQMLRALECELVELFCEVDGNFPNHHPDPSKPENLEALIAAVKREAADLGVAFDGDGDRLGVVDSAGNIIWPDRQMMLFAADVLSREPGADIIYDVKCSRHLAGHILRHGGRPMMWKTGHSLIKARMKETGALLAGEMSGHVFFKERWYGFDDGIYACARLVEILSADPRPTAEIFAELPDSVNTPELGVRLQEGENLAFVDKMRALADFRDAKITDIDGLRVDFADGWGLVRASNTTPSLVIRFEADTAEGLARIQQRFRELLLKVRPDLDLPF